MITDKKKQLSILYAKKNYQLNLIKYYQLKTQIAAKNKNYRNVEEYRKKAQYHARKHNALDAQIKIYEKYK